MSGEQPSQTPDRRRLTPTCFACFYQRTIRHPGALWYKRYVLFLFTDVKESRPPLPPAKRGGIVPFAPEAVILATAIGFAPKRDLKIALPAGLPGTLYPALNKWPVGQRELMRLFLICAADA
jgi:hypothetical protein